MRGIDRRTFIRATGAVGVGGVAGYAGTVRAETQSLQRVGFSGFVRGGAWITAFNEAGQFYADDQGIDLSVSPNEQSAQKQNQDIRQFINQDVDGIIAQVWSAEASNNVIEMAKDEGIPVFTTDADATSEAVDMFVAFGNADGGALSAEEMIKALEDQKPDQTPWRVLNVRGPQGVKTANLRSDGFTEVMEERDDVEVLDTLNGEFARDTAQQRVGEWVNANEVPDAIYSGNLSMGLGVKTALERQDLLVEKGNDDHIVLTQMDGSPEVNPLVSDGFIDAAVDQPNYFYIPLAMKWLKRYVEGDGEAELPEVGAELTSDDISIEPAMHKGVELWSESIWEPATITETDGHRWFKTNSIVITEDNADNPLLWGNIWGNQ